MVRKVIFLKGEIGMDLNPYLNRLRKAIKMQRNSCTYRNISIEIARFSDTVVNEIVFSTADVVVLATYQDCYELQMIIRKKAKENGVKITFDIEEVYDPNEKSDWKIRTDEIMYIINAIARYHKTQVNLGLLHMV